MSEMFELISTEVCRLGFCDDSGLTIPGYFVLVLIPALLYIIFTLLNILQGKSASTADASFDMVNEKIDERFEEINQSIDDKYEEIKDRIDEMRTAYEELLEEKFAELTIGRTTHPLDMLLNTNKLINYKYGRDGELVGYSVLQLSDDGHLANTEHDPSTGNVSSINHISPIKEEGVDFYAETMAKNDRSNLDLLGKRKIIV
jgi:hypothetical protein